MAEVLAIHADEAYIDEKGAFDIAKCDLIAYLNGHYYTLGKKIGRFGFSVQKTNKKKSNSKQKEKGMKNYKKYEKKS